MKNNKKGFTLAELLIVIAIIAILIAIAIPVFGAQLESARLQADHANIRSAYARVQSANLLEETMSGYYCTDGTFSGDAGSNSQKVLIQSDKHKESGSKGCTECVVDCEPYNANAKTKGIAVDTAGGVGKYKLVPET